MWKLHQDSLERRMREADVGPWSAGTIKLNFIKRLAGRPAELTGRHKRGRANPGADVTRFFDLSPKRVSGDPKVMEFQAGKISFWLPGLDSNQRPFD
jgi:hypothetical protein